MTQGAGVVPASQHYIAPWCTEDDIPRNRLLDSSGAPIGDVNMGWMICAATDLLYVLSGRKFKSGRSVVRPGAIVSGSVGGSALYPYSSMAGYGSDWGFATGWAWSAMGSGWFPGNDQSEVVLQGPVRKINSIIVDGTPLGDGDYAVYDRRRLVRLIGPGTNGVAAWPWHQSLQLPITSPGTWQLDYEWGRSPKDSGRLACAALAIELALSFSGQVGAKLPARVLSIASQGVTTAVGDSLEFLKEDLSGIDLVDLFLRAENPQKRRQRSRFLGPDSILGRRL